jgi:hypothetical protein
MMMKRKSFAWSIAAIFAFGLLGFTALNPLRMPESFIEASLLRMAPLGSSSDEVQRALAKKGYGARLVATGFYKQKEPARPEVVGSSSFRVELGQYSTFLVTSVSAFWGFDRSGKLIEVWVWKTVDGP